MTLVNIVCLAGVEDNVNILFKEVNDMSVSQLCRIAYGVRGDSVLTLEVKVSCALCGKLCGKAKSVEESSPESKLIVIAENEGDSDSGNGLFGSTLVRKASDKLVFVFVKAGSLSNSQQST